MHLKIARQYNSQIVTTTKIGTLVQTNWCIRMIISHHKNLDKKQLLNMQLHHIQNKSSPVTLLNHCESSITTNLIWHQILLYSILIIFTYSYKTKYFLLATSTWNVKLYKQNKVISNSHLDSRTRHSGAVRFFSRSSRISLMYKSN